GPAYVPAHAVGAAVQPRLSFAATKSRGWTGRVRVAAGQPLLQTRRADAASRRGEQTRRADAASRRGEQTRRADAGSRCGEQTRRAWFSISGRVRQDTATR